MSPGKLACPDEWKAAGHRKGALERRERGRKIIQMGRANAQGCEYCVGITTSCSEDRREADRESGQKAKQSCICQESLNAAGDRNHQGLSDPAGALQRGSSKHS